MTAIMDPMVSVCMITYNHEPYISQAIEGVLMQKVDFKMELVIGEDCSTDSTRAVCDKYVAIYPDIIKVLPSDNNLGMIPNFIRTLQACTGKYIAMCEGDDFWTDPYKLQKQVDFMEANEQISLVATNYIILDERTGKKRKVFIPKKINYELLLKKKNVIPTLTTCMRSKFVFEYIKDINQYINKFIVGDYPLWLYLSNKGEIVTISDFTAVYLKRNQSVSHKKEIKQQYFFYFQVIDIGNYFIKKYGSPNLAKKYILKNKIYTLINYGYSLGNIKIMKKWIIFFIINQKRLPLKGLIKLLYLYFKKYLIFKTI